MKELVDLIVGLVGGAIGCALVIGLYFLAKYLDFFVKRRLAEHKQRLIDSAKLRSYVVVPRIRAYRTLWSLMEPISPTRAMDLTLFQRLELDASLRSWYYQEGCGMFLSVESQKAFLAARSILRGESKDSVIEAFSRLRTKMKLDIAVYGPGDENQETAVSKGEPKPIQREPEGTFS